MPDFIRLVERLDPRGAFRNSWLKTRVLGES
jgi:xylitol oxidase